MDEQKRRQLETEKDDDVLPEYDFSGKKFVRGKYHKLMQQGYTVTVYNEDGTETVTHYPPEPPIVLSPDVREYFPDSESVNHALRSLIALIPKRKAKKVAAPRQKRKLDL